MYRLFGLAVVLLWVVAMTALFYRDILPAWTAQDPPVMSRDLFADLRESPQQHAIYDAQGRRLGTCWTRASSSSAETTVYGTILLQGLLPTGKVRVETSTDFDQAGEIDAFRLEVYGVPMTVIRVNGERRGIFFPCTIQMGPIQRQVSLDASASRLIGDSVRPFGFLPRLKVGQSWRMQIVDPMSLMRRTSRMTSIVATVTGREEIDYLGRPVECFVVQTSPLETRAWVLPDGRVARQEVQAAGLGRIAVQEEPYREQDLIAARRAVSAGPDRREQDGAGIDWSLPP